MDFSDLPTDHKFHSNVNKKIIGKFKDELNGVHIVEFVGLRPKMYSIMSVKGEKHTAKGIGKAAIKKDINHQKYKDALFSTNLNRVRMQRIQSRRHQLHTIELNKIGLNPADDKRYLLDDGIQTHSYGHCDIIPEEEM